MGSLNDSRWSSSNNIDHFDIVEKNISEVLTDHAWCEQKAATNAISIVVSNPERVDLVTDMLDLAKEEIEHFQLVHNIIKEDKDRFWKVKDNFNSVFWGKNVKTDEDGYRVHDFADKTQKKIKIRFIKI